MNKVRIVSSLLLVASMQYMHARGGDVAAGLAAGLLTGAVVTSAASQSSSSDREARQMHREQQEKIEQLRKEAENREALRKDLHLSQLDAHLKQVEREHQASQHSVLLWVMIALIGLLLAVIVVLAVIIVRRHQR